VAWTSALASGTVFNAKEACEHLGIDEAQMAELWNIAKDKDRLIKFGGGFYCAQITVGSRSCTGSSQSIYVFNGFFLAMRSKFTAPSTAIYYYNVQWNAELPWADFRAQVLGTTDPAEAPKDSLRGIIYSNWKGLGLEAPPNTGDNGVHASASAFEGLAERCNWMESNVESDPYGMCLIQRGIPLKYLRDGMADPQVKLDSTGKMGSLFDELEDLDALHCTDKLLVLSKL